MEFFRIAEIAEQSIAIVIGPEYWRMAMIYGGAGFLIMFVFQAIALYTVASRAGIKHKWMAFVPFLSTYYIGVCSQKNKALWLDSKLVGIIAASLEFVLCAGYAMHYIGFHFAQPYMDLVDIQLPYFYASEEIPLPQVYEINWDALPFGLYWAGFCFETLYTILYFGRYLYYFVMVMLLSAFFQTYMPRRYLLFTILGVIFPIKGIFFFVVRNNNGTSYREYVMREQERRYRMYRQYTQNNSYNQQNYGGRPYDGNGEYSRPDIKNDDPFEEFGHSDDDPFNN